MKKKDIIPPSETETQEEQVVKQESKARKIIGTVINVVLVVAIVLAAVSTYISYVSSSGNGSPPNILGMQMLSIQTNSMYPTLKPGDLIFAKKVDDPKTLEVGDIITYWTVINGERVLNTHTIVEIYDEGYRIFSTKGDNNTSKDPLMVHEAEVIGKYSWKIDGLGKFVDYLQTSEGFLIVVVLPVFIFFLFYLVQFFRVLFEYQNVKNRIKYEQERGRTEDLLAEQERKQQEQKEQERAAMEAELREKLKAELLASMGSGEKVPEEEAPAKEETPAEEPAQEEAPKEDSAPTEE
ncbi:MAG: signal peptidase I [Ruminococcaceae bacterium]|nr:signal peptidase I [Oscillospiraceae bacterium]